MLMASNVDMRPVKPKVPFSDPNNALWASEDGFNLRRGIDRLLPCDLVTVTADRQLWLVRGFITAVPLVPALPDFPPESRAWSETLDSSLCCLPGSARQSS